MNAVSINVAVGKLIFGVLFHGFYAERTEEQEPVLMMSACVCFSQARMIMKVFSQIEFSCS